jgi:DNA processing protein
MEDIKSISIEDKNYPELLKKIPGAPGVLYFKGILPNSEDYCFAIVGTRRCSSYGQQIALKISGELADAGLTIVSGLAPGIDTFSHRAVVEKKKRTIAILGTGLDEKSLYPQTNLDLSKKIIANGGCLISELPPGTRGSKFTFPKRNRIISGLSLGVLVIEAKEKSGSLITANYAISQGKNLFAVPGPIFSLNSKGPNQLIKNGAKLVEGPEDVISGLGLVGLFSLKQKSKKDIETENKEEWLVFGTLKEEPLHIDKIIEKTNLSASVVATTLALMEISGKIRSLGGNIYAVS